MLSENVTGSPTIKVGSNECHFQGERISGDSSVLPVPFARLLHSTTQTISANSDLAVAFNAEQYDTDEMHDTSTNNSRVTATTGGIYMCQGWAIVQGSSGSAEDHRRAFIRKGGSVNYGADNFYRSATGDHRFGVSAIVPIAVGEYVEFILSSGEDQSLTVRRTADSDPAFHVVWIGPFPS